ncbi:hypothetical protein E2562_009982 [Oryza meyeriana var. granulata]|uniref:Uncharacterized protein n=1 Tax=Oryza meyeriana var. granulata TaxID=110450 RepID=A0A6G1EHQ3_9ORYZ|nr:hypothetical protein E2562_009982 [Oryza meyeriana var. granulata]
MGHDGEGGVGRRRERDEWAWQLMGQNGGRRLTSVSCIDGTRDEDISRAGACGISLREKTKLKKKIKDPVMMNIPTECNQHLCSYLGPAKYGG